MTTRDHCCPLIKPSQWNGKKHVWKNKLFMMDKVVQFMHMPLNMKQVVSRMWKRIMEANAAPLNKDFLMLAYDPSPWTSEIYMNITKNVPDGNMIKLSGTYITKVFDGPFNAVPKWIKEMDAYLEKRKMKVIKYYFYFTMCPKCIKEKGHNYCIVFAQVK